MPLRNFIRVRSIYSSYSNLPQLNEQNLMLLFPSLVKKFATELKLIYLNWNSPRSGTSIVPGRDP